jgi:magnesium transporter
MIKVYKTLDNKFNEVNKITNDCWVNVINPTENEIESIQSLGIPIEFIRNPLDIDERSQTDKEKGATLIIIRIPYYQGENVDIPYITIPLGIILTGSGIITISRHKNELIENILNRSINSVLTIKRNRFVLIMLFTAATLFLDSLRKIKNNIDALEDELESSVRNKELLELLKFQKSLQYLSTALTSNELIFEKLQRYKFFKQYPEDLDLLDDVITENQQAIEMTSITSNLLIQMMDAYSSIIQNNQNIVFKIMTTVTIIMSLPTIISGFFGMNVAIPYENNPNAFLYILIFSILLMVIIAYIFKKQHWL